jgi:hypothetical protein
MIRTIAIGVMLGHLLLLGLQFYQPRAAAAVYHAVRGHDKIQLSFKDI